MRPIEATLRTKITEALQPDHLDLVNESPQHGLPLEAEKHFRALVVSAKFRSLSRVERHRLIHQSLQLELATHVHALGVQAFTPEEWATKGEAATVRSPPCAGHGPHRQGD